MAKRPLARKNKIDNSEVPSKVAKKNINGDVSTTIRTYFKDPGSVLTFGQGDVGQLGLGQDIMEKSRPAVVSKVSNIIYICAGGMHTLCLTKNGKVFSFGCNDEGTLGRDGNEFDPIDVNLPDKVVQITAGDSHSAALLVDGRVYAWGSFRDSHGTMGLTLQGIEKYPVLVPVDEKVIKIASGADHLVMLTAKGEVYTSGCGEQGQLGRVCERSSSRTCRQGLGQFLVPGRVSFPLNKKMIIDDIWAGQYSTYLKDKLKGNIYVVGLNNYNQLGIVGKDRYYHPEMSKSLSKIKWTLITGGQHHSIALDTDGKVYALGRKEYGRLGLGQDCTDASEPTVIPGLTNKKCLDVACGSCVSYAVTDEGEVYAWGMGTNGQLGTGEEEDVYVPTVVRGKELKERKVKQASGGGQHTVLLAV